MASVTEKPQPDSPPQPNRAAAEHLVDQQIGRTRRALKVVDITAGLITLAIGVLAYLLTISVLEHWVIPGGWSAVARGLLFAGLVLGIAWYSWRTFWPLLRQPINPAYAALAIEQSSPSLKNSLLNLLLLRTRKREMSRQVFQAIESQAAQGLSQVRMETVVDRSAILRLGYILVALTAICVLYRVLSPKDLFSSAGRVLLPWSNIATPSRVTIADITPGNTKTARGERLKITTEVLGLETDEPVRLLYSTDDKQIVRQEIPMTGAESGTLFSCQVPARIGGGDRRGVQQDFTYWIEAGDARSPRYTVTVFARPTLVVNRLRYDYPAYTGYPSREVEHTGDIRAVEGTKVTLFAEANRPIKSAHVDFEADGRRDLLMNATDQQATVTFPLRLRDDRRTPEHQSYVLKYTDGEGNQNLLPPKYQIDVQPDYAPEIQLLLPEEAVLDVALNKEIDFELEARDPDFALRQVMLIGKVGEEQKLQEELLTHNHTGKFVGKLRKTPEQMGLKPGDILEYWGAAADNRLPEPNLAYSAHRKIRVTGPWRGNEQGEQNQEGEGEQQKGEGGESQDGEGGQDGQAGGGEQGNSDNGEGQEGAEGQGGMGQEGGEPNENNQQQNGGEGSSKGEQNDNNDSQGGGANGNSPSDDSSNDGEENSGAENSGEQNQAGDASDDSSAGEGGEQGKVSSEGDDDGAAFERMAEHFNEQEGQSGDGDAKADPSDSNSNDAAGRPDSDQSSDGSESEDNAREGNQPDGSEQGKQQDRNSAGEGANGESAEGKQQDGSADEQPPQDGESPDGQMSGEQGDAGAGDNSSDSQGAPNSEGEKKPQDKQGDGSDGPDEKNSEAASSSDDNSESDSEGAEGGDRSGGGKEGAGQQADESGKGSAGQNESADEGAGRSSEKGEGETGEQAGGEEKADGETGESSGDQQGNGSEQGKEPGEQADGKSPSEGPNGEQQNGQPGEQADGQQPGNNQPSGQQPPPGESDSSDAQGSAGEPAGTGGNTSSPPPSSELEGADDANLEYAKKQTDLILERLEDQLKQKEVDKSLLEKLGWTPDDLRRFVDRWKNLKSDAEAEADGSEQLNDALRSLGLNPNRRTGYNSKITKDKLRDLQEAYRGRVPLEYQEQVNRYIKGTSNSQEKE